MRVFLSIAALLLLPIAIRAADPVTAEILKWRADHDRDVLAADGPFTLVARLTARQGLSSIGRDASNDLVVPVSTAPPRVGTIEWRGGEGATFRVAHGVTALVDGKPISEVTISQAVNIRIGDLSFRGGTRNGVLRVSIQDPNSAMRKSAKPPVWFPVDLRYRINAAWTGFAQPRTVRIPDNDGGSREWKSPGYVSFMLDGQRITLQAVLIPDGKQLSFFFRDGTAGHETYGAGRFLEADLPKDGKVLMDFNEAYNPFCNYNALYICPIPPAENHMTVRIPVGERNYPHPGEER